MLADDVIDAHVPVLKQMIDVYNETKLRASPHRPLKARPSPLTACSKEKKLRRSGGKLFEVLDMVEKPKLEDAPSNLAVIGRYIFTPTVFETLSKIKPGAGGELQLTDGLRKLLKKKNVCVRL